MRLSPPKSYDPWFSLLSTRRYTLIDIAWLWSLLWPFINRRWSAVSHFLPAAPKLSGNGRIIGYSDSLSTYLYKSKSYLAATFTTLFPHRKLPSRMTADDSRSLCFVLYIYIFVHFVVMCASTIGRLDQRPDGGIFCCFWLTAGENGPVGKPLTVVGWIMAKFHIDQKRETTVVAVHLII